MRNKIPNTPFATRLSGSAKETQLRIRSMFQWKKKRPPVWLFAFVVVVIFGCIGLVSCREKEDALCMGLNARVVEIDTEQMILYIQDIDKDAAVFGQRCALDCKQAAEEKKLIFVDYETSDLTDIPFAEFQVGDELVISMLTSQKEGAKDASALAEQVQLGTQRPLYVTYTQAANWYDEFIENCWNDGKGYQYTGFTEFTEGDRTLTVQDVPENLAEELLFSDYYFRTVFEFDGLLGIQGSDSLRIGAENERKNAAEGMYFERVTIHNLAALDKEDFEPGGAYFADAERSFQFVDTANFMKDEYGLTEYAVVYVDLSWQWSEKALAMGPQLGNGRYERLYLVGKTSEDDNWRIYECFWGEYDLGRVYAWEEFAIQLLEESLCYENEALSFTIPTPMQAGTGIQAAWNIRIVGRTVTEGLDGMSRHYLDGEVWEAGKTYTLEIPIEQQVDMTELRMEVSVEGMSREIDLMDLLQIDGPKKTVASLNEGKNLLIDHFQQYYNRVYFLGEESGEPQEGDLRIDSVRYLGSEVTFETTGEAYLVRTSIYIEGIESADSQPVTKWWPVDQASYLVLGRGMDGELYEVRGERLDMREGVKRMIQEESYGVDDWEVTLWHDANPYPQPLAVGRWDEMALSLVRESVSMERLEGWEPIYWEGDFWEQYTIDGLSVLRYYNSRESTYVTNTVELARDDFHTQRGIRVGDTREAVKAAYPELKSGDYWGKYPGEDYLWYCEGVDDFGPALIFFFENDKVSKIVLNNMFN